MEKSNPVVGFVDENGVVSPVPNDDSPDCPNLKATGDDVFPSVNLKLLSDGTLADFGVVEVLAVKSNPFDVLGIAPPDGVGGLLAVKLKLFDVFGITPPFEFVLLPKANPGVSLVVLPNANG